ncbi:MAG: hypothetical protein ACYDER_24355 [Ktedonobacteraceae bacterium]
MDDTKQPLDKPDDTEEQIVPLDEAPVTPKRSQLPFAKRLTFRQRKISWRLSIALCLLLLIILVVPNSLASVSNVTAQLYDRLAPPPTPTIAPGLDTFYFDMNIPWTQVSIDGRNIHIPTIGSGAPVRLSPGKHIVRWNAAPFQAQSCFVTVPVQFYLNDTCVLATDDLSSFSHAPHAQLLVLHESISTLPVSQQNVLTDVIQKALEQHDISTTVQPGEMYFGPKGYTSAYQPSRATLRFQLDTSASSSAMTAGRTSINGMQTYTINAEDCLILCSIPWQLLLSSPPSSIPDGVSLSSTWFAFAFTSQSLDYTTMNSSILAQGQPTDYGASIYFSPVLVGISRNGTNWHVKVFFQQDLVPFYSTIQASSPQQLLYNNPACAAVQNYFMNIGPIFSHIRFTPAPNAADGCLAIATWNPASNTIPPQSPYLWFLDRFGILFAVNAAATHQKFISDYLQANPYVQHLAQQLSTLPGVVINLG